jgi:hypothetical protein
LWGYDSVVTFAALFRVLSALFLSLIYAAFAGVCTFVWWRLTHDPAYPGPMIPDNNAWGRLMVIAMIVFTALVGAFVGLCVSLTQSRKLYGALFGGGVGLVIFLMYLADMLRSVSSPSHTRGEILLSLGVSFVVFPVGLTLLAIAASALASMTKRAG